MAVILRSKSLHKLYNFTAQQVGDEVWQHLPVYECITFLLLAYRLNDKIRRGAVLDCTEDCVRTIQFVMPSLFKIDLSMNTEKIKCFMDPFPFSVSL